MSFEGVQLVIGLALTDQRFRDLLVDKRKEALAQVSLSKEESQAMMQITAGSFREFCQKLDRWVEVANRRQPVPAGADWDTGYDSALAVAPMRVRPASSVSRMHEVAQSRR